MKKFTFLAILTIVILSFSVPAFVLAGDTGTYQIKEYSIVLVPQPTGEVTITYSQTWLVTGGHIPWITVGLPNDSYNITDFGGAAKEVKSANETGWCGVRIELDQDYEPDEVFQFDFTITQHRILEQNKDGSFRLVFTPGWYDRCFIDLMSIKVISPVSDNLTFDDPQPSSIEGQGKEIVWQKMNLGKGEKFTVSVSFPPNAFADFSPDEKKEGGGIPGWAIALLVILGLIIIFVIIAVVTDGFGGGDGYGGPIIFAGGGHGSSGGSGGFGGSSGGCVSCACACACACAGGGGAGCARKANHSCKSCQKEEKNG